MHSLSLSVHPHPHIARLKTLNILPTEVRALRYQIDLSKIKIPILMKLEFEPNTLLNLIGSIKQCCSHLVAASQL